jgi:hypothetical protein
MESLARLAVLSVIVIVLSGCSGEIGESSSATSTPCKVSDPDIGASYAGPCSNGLAEGRGQARGRDAYEGEFSAGSAHGRGVYIWGTDTDWSGHRYEGEFVHDTRSGFGTYSVPAADAAEFYTKNGKRVGDRLVVTGLWIDGELEESCDTEIACYGGATEEGGEAEETTGPTASSRQVFTAKSVMRLVVSEVSETDKQRVHCALQEGLTQMMEGQPSTAVVTAVEAQKLIAVFSDKRKAIKLLGQCSARIAAGTWSSKGGDDPYQDLDMNELLVDIDNFRDGDMIRVVGVGRVIDAGGILGSVLQIGKTPASSSVLVDFSKIPRDQKLALVEACDGGPAVACRLRVEGKTGDIMVVQSGIVADAVQVLVE